MKFFNIVNVFGAFVALTFATQSYATKPVIMLTGYWPPTNEMLRPWSNNPAQNPKGWIGENWKSLGYDVYAFFPEYPNWANGDDIGEGDFTVDINDTYADFIRYAQILKPIAVVSFGLDASGAPWQLEVNYPNYWQQFWPTGSPPGVSTLPVQEIHDAVNLALGKNTAEIDSKGNAGGYLCGYLGRLVTRYQAKHSDPKDPLYMKAAGFIHVGRSLKDKELNTAVEETLKTLIRTL